MPFYPVLPFILLILMNQNPDYRNLLFILFILIAAFDTGSYCTGMLIGRHNIAPTISPAKTWEGFAGGYFFALIGLLLVIWKSNSSPSFSFIMIFTLVTCILALCGDLFESSLKRRVGIKDSGTILPGHGGFLDRFDGILLTVFFFYVFKNYFVTILG